MFFEIIDETFDGVQNTFNLKVTYAPGSLIAFSPTLLTPTEVTENGGTSFSLTTPPDPGDLLVIFYRLY